MEKEKRSLFPTRYHEAAALSAADFFHKRDAVDAVLLTCSCARGKAAAGSCVDISVLVQPNIDKDARNELEAAWSKEYASNDVFASLLSMGRYSHVDLDFSDGEFPEGYHGWCSGPDEFELEIGNLLGYSVALYERGSRLNDLRRKWLPYYGSELRTKRLHMVRRFCVNNIDHIAPFVERELYFQAFRRLYNAMGEFLQALFITNRTYPIAYDKWIKEQLTEILQFPQIYVQLVSLMSIENLESTELTGKAEVLRELVERYCVEDNPSSNPDPGDGDSCA